MSEAKFVVALDIDEVLAQYLQGYLDFRRSLRGCTRKVSDFHTYKFWEVTGDTLEQCQEEVLRFQESDFFRNLQVVPGAKAAVTELASIPGVELHAVTSRHAEVTEETKRWLEQHFPGHFQGRVHIGNHWGTDAVVRVSKPDMCAKIGAKVLIDDNPGYCREVAAAGFQAALFDLYGGYGWSKEPVPGPRIARVQSWPEAVALVRRMWETSRSHQPQDCPPSQPRITAVHWPPATKEDLKPARDCSPCGPCTVS